jgi:methionyl-tRNA formyltransferase
VKENDDAQSITAKMLRATSEALRALIPSLASGTFISHAQIDSEATYFGRRAPDDGCIEWAQSSAAIERLIRATTRPLPGAFTFWNDRKLVIWKCRRERKKRIQGVVGRVLALGSEGDLLVQTGQGHIWLTDYDVEGDPRIEIRVGDLLGYNVQVEIYKLKRTYKAQQ